MIEIRNKKRFPVQLIIRSRRTPNSFTTLNVPGVGKGKNIYYLEDERVTPYIERIEKMGFITTKYIPNREMNKVDKGE